MHTLSPVSFGSALHKHVLELFSQCSIHQDVNLDYLCALLDENENPIAAGGCFRNTLRCFAVMPAYRGQALLNEIVSHLLGYTLSRGFTHVFVYTKAENVPFFQSLGFYSVAATPNGITLLENRKQGFRRYLDSLLRESASFPKTAEHGAVVVNANPVTNGHILLLEQAAKQCDCLHVFLLQEDVSAVPHSVRKQLLLSAASKLPNLVFHSTGPYLISSATFPGYFFPAPESALLAQIELDAAVFLQISSVLGITLRFFGTEPYSKVTAAYNQHLIEVLPPQGVRCTIIPRFSQGGQIISASTVRSMLAKGQIEEALPMLPEETRSFWCSPEAAPVIKRIIINQSG